jgi:hypothetical protein
MRIVVSDSSCLIDLRKVSLLDIFLQLPYEFLIPNTLFEEELLRFSAAQKRALVRVVGQFGWIGRPFLWPSRRCSGSSQTT